MSNEARGPSTGDVAKDAKDGGLVAALSRLVVALWAMACAATELSFLALRGAWLWAQCGWETMRSAWLGWRIDRQLRKRR